MSESAERIYALLVEANPVPDVDAVSTTLERPHLRVIDTRRDDMQTQDTAAPEMQALPPTRRSWIPAAAAAAIVVVAATIGVFVFAGGDTETVAPPETPTDTALAVIDTWNTGDVPAFFEWFGDEATVMGTPVDAFGVYSDLGFYMTLGQEVVVDECTELGEARVLCQAQISDDLSGPLGVVTPITWEFEFVDGQIATLAFSFPPADQPDVFAVAGDAVLWVQETDLSLFDSTFRPDGSCITRFNNYAIPTGWCSSIEGAEELLRLGDEFRAQYDF
jgi:hypothetical protein